MKVNILEKETQIRIGNIIHNIPYSYWLKINTSLKNARYFMIKYLEDEDLNRIVNFDSINLPIISLKYINDKYRICIITHTSYTEVILYLNSSIIGIESLSIEDIDSIVTD